MGIKGLMLANSVGIVDADYRGELLACVYNRTDSVIQLSHGQRIVQGIILPYSPAIITEKKVNDTIRADGGFGSTGL
jgi:dUTP pyrophosphatase